MQMVDASNLLEGWRDVDHRKQKFFPGDIAVLEQSPKRTSTARTTEEFVKQGGLDPSHDRVIQLGLQPQPFVGDLGCAKVIFLLRNPGLSAGDFRDEQDDNFLEALLANLRQEPKRKCPFLFLDPNFAWTGAGQWWRNKLHPLIRQMQTTMGGPESNESYAEAMRVLSKQVAAIELLGYHSKWSAVSAWTSLPSSQAARSYAKKIDRKKIHLLNGRDEWRSEIRTLKAHQSDKIKMLNASKLLSRWGIQANA